MTDFGKALITNQTAQKLNQFFSRLSSGQVTLLDQIKEEILSHIQQYALMPDFRTPVKKVEAIFLKKAAHLSQDEQAILKRALVAKLALHLPAIVENMNLPPSILALYPDAFGRLADFLQRVGNEPYNSTGEFFCKDVRFVLGLSIPCGARVVDMISCIALPSVILSLFRSRKVNGIIRYFRVGGHGTWCRGHVDSRYLTEFNEQGHDNHYLRVADLLKRQKDIKGLVITSWYYDPHVQEISPRLAYLHDRPGERGAFFLQHGADRSDVLNAIKTSATRRRLYHEGKYKPVCYSMLWPRQELIAWADQSRISLL